MIDRYIRKGLLETCACLSINFLYRKQSLSKIRVYLRRNLPVFLMWLKLDGASIRKLSVDSNIWTQMVRISTSNRLIKVVLVQSRKVYMELINYRSERVIMASFHVPLFFRQSFQRLILFLHHQLLFYYTSL